MSINWDGVYSHLNSHKDLTPALAKEVMTEILEGRATEEEIKGFLLALKNKGESATDISLLVGELLRYALPKIGRAHV